MLEPLVNTFVKVTQERLRNHFLASYVVCWGAKNWQVFFYSLDNSAIETKLENIGAIVSHSDSWFHPAIFAFLFVLLSPLLSVGTSIYTDKISSFRRYFKQGLDDKAELRSLTSKITKTEKERELLEKQKELAKTQTEISEFKEKFTVEVKVVLDEAQKKFDEKLEKIKFSVDRDIEPMLENHDKDIGALDDKLEALSKGVSSIESMLRDLELTNTELELDIPTILRRNLAASSEDDIESEDATSGQDDEK